ncbi:Pkinase-domain-containing protein [Parathielavia hyrcaniae]|uniref:non-specific serine/threonine protein kinase n=1 Tax=Parathielavia hyrcaniae TaxID=113614 RepID=A0AAN6Q7B4_9PEZI|nr:Pkinase-domain-containing protein [Parathielavia hyrcaniae]
MEHRGTSRHPAPRQPLGDATQRINHATVANVNRRYEAADVENHILSKFKNAAHGCSNSVLPVHHLQAEQRIHHVPAPTAPPDPAPANPRLAAISQNPHTASDPRRVSQFSNVSSNASSTRQLKTHIGPWQLGKTLGKGSSARVRLARHRVSHQLVAIKIVAKSTAHMTQAGSLANLDRIDYRNPTTGADGGLRRMPLAIEREVAILKLIRHPNIIELLDIWENRSEIYLVTEYVEKGDLFEFINWNGPLQEEEAIFYFRQIMTALEYCHSFNICHRDLKPENILLKANGQIKIADFGMAALQQNPNHQLRTACGSPHYAAPELLRHQFYKGSAVDIWSMGVILFAMLAGRLPFDDDDMGIMLSKAKRAEYKMPSHLTREAKDLVRRILVDQPAHRITMKQMWRHALLKKYDYLDEYHKWDGQSQHLLRSMGTTPMPEEIDIQILRQLKALWHTYSESALEEKLRQDKPNDQKLFYWLLYNHREAQLENYNNNVPISKSDFHHLKPPNWGRRISTCQFTKPGRNSHARTVSKFTVISNVADVDEVGTVRNYDPYNASHVLQPCGSQVSHAKITVHRNGTESRVGPSPTNVSHSYRSYHSVNGSFRQRARTNTRRTSTAGQLKSPQASMSSIRSQQSNPRVRANNRSKRSVDFSSIRTKVNRHRRNRHVSLPTPASTAGSSTTYFRDALSPVNQAKESGTSRVRTTRSMVEVGDTTDDTFIWSEELEQLGHRIARHCDEAFGSSLLVTESSNLGADSREVSPFMLSLGTLPAVQPSTQPTSAAEAHPWDNRPLPPVPSQSTVSPLSVRIASNVEPSYKLHPRLDVPVSERRVVSEPVYDRPSKDVRQLPSIYEHASDNWLRHNDIKHGMASNALETPTRVKNNGLDFLAKAEKTIRAVNSPSAVGASGAPVEVPEPLNVRKFSPTTGTAKPALTPSLHDTSRHTSYGSNQSAQTSDGNGADAVPSKKRVSSWFKRSSKENASGSSFATVTESSGRSKETSAYAEGTRLNRPTLQKKKSFGFPFWKGAKEEVKMSLADSDPDETRSRNEKSTKGRYSRQSKLASGMAHSVWSESDGGIRKIEVQQNWLARLFRVKPAMRYLCFNILKRRARQEMAILLRECRKYGIKDVEVDKGRNIIFARVGSKNYLNLREVSFAVELMTVIEHGKRNQLSIARFTQEKGAASSFHKVVDAINAAFATRSLLVTDKRKVNMMIKTLNS